MRLEADAAIGIGRGPTAIRDRLGHDRFAKYLGARWPDITPEAAEEVMDHAEVGRRTATANRRPPWT